MYKILISLLYLLFQTFFHAQGQTIFGELVISNNKITNIQSFDTGNKILLTYSEKDLESRKVKRTYLIYHDGRIKQIQTNIKADALLLEAMTFGKQEYIYYCVDKGKDIVLWALAHDDSTNTATTLASEIALQGALLASWTDKNLNLILYHKTDNQLEVIKLNKLDVISRKKITAPVDIGGYLKNIEHISYDATISIAQGSSPAKLYHDEDHVFITIDKTSYELLPNVTPETLVLKFDLANETSSSQKISFGGTQRFSSFLFRDKIYRLCITPKSYELKTFDLVKKKLVDVQQISKGPALKDSLIYFRDGKGMRVARNETFSRMMNVSDLCFPSIVLYEENDSITTIVSGNYYGQKGMGTFAGTDMFEGFVTFIITTGIKQMAERPGISRYIYMRRPDKGGEDISLRERIDNYEISLEAKSSFFDYKSYMDFEGGVLAIYHNADVNKLIFVLFSRNQNSTSTD